MAKAHKEPPTAEENNSPRRERSTLTQLNTEGFLSRKTYSSHQNIMRGTGEKKRLVPEKETKILKKRGIMLGSRAS